MTDVFLCGPLADRALRVALLGAGFPGRPARLVDHALVRVAGGAGAGLVARGESAVDGLLAAGLPADLKARLTRQAAAWGLVSALRPVATGSGDLPATVFLAPLTAGDRDAADWDAAGWATHWSATVTETATDLAALAPETDDGVVAERYRQMLVRGSSRVRARASAPTAVRHLARPQDVTVLCRRSPYQNFFALQEYDLTHRRFDGGRSPAITRAAFVSGDAVTVLPYDPVRDRVLLVEQVRVGPLARGDAQCWQLEAIAGRVDPDETPEEAARREAVEEAGLSLGALLPVANYYPSPGAVTEYLYSYVALCDLPDGAAGVFGVEGEAEDIRGHLMALDDLLALLSSGEVANAPLILTALWLQRERPRLRAGG